MISCHHTWVNHYDISREDLLADRTSFMIFDLRILVHVYLMFVVNRTKGLKHLLFYLRVCVCVCVCMCVCVCVCVFFFYCCIAMHMFFILYL